MSWNNLIVVFYALHNVAKAYIKVVNYISAFVGPTLPTNIITNETILTHYSNKQGLKVFGKRSRLQYKNNCGIFMTTEFLSQRILKALYINNKDIDWHIQCSWNYEQQR